MTCPFPCILAGVQDVPRLTASLSIRNRAVEMGSAGAPIRVEGVAPTTSRGCVVSNHSPIPCAHRPIGEGADRVRTRRTRSLVLSLGGILLFQFLGLSALAAPFTGRDPAPLSNLKYLRDHAETRGFSLGRPFKALPTPDGQAVLFLRAGARTPKLELHEFDIASANTRLLLTPWLPLRRR